MTAYDSGRGSGTLISTQKSSYDFERLERAVAGLVETVRKLREEREDLQRSLDESNHRVLGLEEKLRATNQRRQDAMKRLDDLIAQMDQLDARYEAEAQSA